MLPLLVELRQAGPASLVRAAADPPVVQETASKLVVEALLAAEESTSLQAAKPLLLLLGASVGAAAAATVSLSAWSAHLTVPASMELPTTLEEGGSKVVRRRWAASPEALPDQEGAP